MSRLQQLIDRESKVLIVSLLCLASACVSLFFILDDYADDSTLRNGREIAHVGYSRSEVRRKKSNSFAWSSVEESSRLYVRDSIKTGRAGAVIIEMDKGGSLELGENSLLVLNEIQDISTS